MLAPSGILVFQVPCYDAESSKSAQSAQKRPLDPSACRARIRPASESLAGQAGERVSLRVTVENAGDRTWPSVGRPDGGLRVWLGGHLAAQGDDYYWRHDAMRRVLSRDLDPGQDITLEAWLTLPEENGDYLLELDMVQEHVCWFRQRGSETAVVHCRVEGGRARVPGGGQLPRVRRSVQAPAWWKRAWWLAGVGQRSKLLARRIRTWVAQAGRDAGERSDGLRTEERDELRRLRRENRRLREEREILAKATAWFAREARPGRSTGS